MQDSEPHTLPIELFRPLRIAVIWVLPRHSFISLVYLVCVTTVNGVTCGVTVSMSAFLALHQCYCAGSSLAWGLESSGYSMWDFLKLVARGFLWILRFPPHLHRFNGSANQKEAKIHAISTLSNVIAELSLRTTWHATRHVARDKRSMCCT